MGLNLSVQVAIGGKLTLAGDLATAEVPVAIRKQIDLITGTGAGQANALWMDQRTIAASGNDDLDLAGVLVDQLGVAANFTKIKGIYVFAAAANVNDVLVGGLGTNGMFTWLGATGDLVKVKPGGLFLLVTPDVNAYAVTAATADLLRITNGGAGTSVVYDIALLGTV